MGKKDLMTVASHEAARYALQQADDQAWQAYERMCWTVDATAAQKRVALKDAVQTTDALLEFDRKAA